MTTTHIKEGDIVYLKSEVRIKLTVTYIEENVAFVAWFHDGEIKTAKIMAIALIRVS